MTEHLCKLRPLAVAPIAAYQGVRAIRYWVSVVGDYILYVCGAPESSLMTSSPGRDFPFLMHRRIPVHDLSQYVSHHNSAHM